MELIEIPDYQAIRDTFSDELTRAAHGKTTSLPFIHNQLPVRSLVQPGEVFQSIVIGGTNGEVATLCYEKDGSLTIIDHQSYPNLNKFRTIEGFLSFIDQHIGSAIHAVGVSFAGELIPVTGTKGQLDGILNEGETKGHGFHGLQQQQVGTVIEDHFRSVHNREIVVSVGNDTVALLAATATRAMDRDKQVAGIIGTGYNLALFLDSRTIINIQASDFTGFIPTKSGIMADERSSNPGHQLYDKEVAKLFAQYNALINKQMLKGTIVEDNKALAAMAQSDSLGSKTARALFERSAKLVAAQLAGLYNFKSRPKKLTATMQGSLYWEGPNYKEMLVNELLQLEVPTGAIAFERLEYADILGAAKLITGGM